MSNELLQEVINDFDIATLHRFFRAKNTSAYKPNEDDLSDDDYDDRFSDIKQIGTFAFSDIERLIVVTASVTGELSERSSKKAQYELAKKILRELDKYEAGIFIFCDTNGNFRFSLIHPQYQGTKVIWSNFRRFTYYVSLDQTNKTFLKQIGKGDFSSLDKIKESFSVEKVTKDFYKDIANWYFWAVQNVEFPKDAEAEHNGRNIAVIRLITRLIFVWFMRERKLVPSSLFEEEHIRANLKDIGAEESTYYHAILQNLFFATLSTKQSERKFRSEARGHKGYNPDFGNQYVYRYQELYKSPDQIKTYFDDIPFLNGGLFECLDDKERQSYIDGFTSTKKHQPVVPNFLFFSEERDADLNTEYGTKSKRYKVRGLLTTLSFYNFTIDENDPNDAEIALDPELLGKVFENLLASFNPETASTARKATGSYYTPRQIVDYMVTQSLKEYLRTNIEDTSDLDAKLDQLFDVEATVNPFKDRVSKTIVGLIDNLRVVDPAVGSGAFPMGMLNRLVFILGKLDPDNRHWKDAQTEAIKANVSDPVIKRKLIEQVCEQFKNKNFDYGRKLYLIQKCIYGVDIQQIAVEISKLRFFISLLVHAQIDRDKDNLGIEPLPNLDFKIMQGNSLVDTYEGVSLFNERLLSRSSKNEIQNKLEHIEFQLSKNDSLRMSYYRDNPKWMKSKQQEKPAELLALENNNKILNSQKKTLIDDLETFDTLGTQDELGLFAESRSKSLGDELKRLHKDYFATQEKQNKDKLKEQIEELEWELIEATLKESNKTSKLANLHKFKTSNTKPFFLWKLYFAEVFQGDNPGFDIVVGNPPYLLLQNSDLSIEDQDHLISNYRSAQYKVDLYHLFIELGLDLQSTTGILAYITPNTFMRNKHSNLLRGLIVEHNNILRLILFYVKVFDDPSVDNIVIITQKHEHPNLNNHSIGIQKVSTLQGVTIGDELQFVAQATIQPSDYYFHFEESGEHLALIRSLEEHSVPFGSIGRAYFGLQTHSRKQFVSHTKEDRNYRPVIDGTNVTRYYLKKSQEYVCFLPEAVKSGGDPTVYERDRIVVRQIGKYPEGTLCPKGIITLNTIYNLYLNDNTYLLEYILAIVNSRLIRFLWSVRYYDHKATFPKIKKGPLESLPIKTIPIEEQEQIVLHVRELLKLKKETPTIDTSDLDDAIDKVIYRLYKLSQDQIDIIENQLNSKC